MGNVPVQFRTRKPRKILKHAKRKEILENKFEDVDEKPIDTQHLLISTLLPYAVKAFIEECEREVTTLCGRRYERGFENSRWGTQDGSIVLANQRIAIEKPRVRKKSGDEVPLQTYQDFQDPRPFDQAVFTEGLKRVSQRDYKKASRRLRTRLVCRSRQFRSAGSTRRRKSLKNFKSAICGRWIFARFSSTAKDLESTA